MVIHLPGENQPGRGKACELRFGQDGERIEGAGINPVNQRADMGGRWQPLGKQGCFLVGDQQAGIGAGGKSGFLGLEQARFTRVYQSHRGIAALRIGFKLRRIDIDEIDHQLALPVCRNILPHLPGKHIDGADIVLLERVADVIRQPGIAECREADRFARQQRARAGERQRQAALRHVARRRQSLQIAFCGRIALIVGKGRHMHPGEPCQGF